MTNFRQDSKFSTWLRAIFSFFIREHIWEKRTMKTRKCNSALVTPSIDRMRFKWSFRVCCYRDFRHLSMDEDSVVLPLCCSDGFGWNANRFSFFFRDCDPESWAKAEKWNLSNYWMFDFRLLPMSLLVLWQKCWTSPLDFGVQKRKRLGVKRDKFKFRKCFVVLFLSSSFSLSWVAECSPKKGKKETFTSFMPSNGCMIVIYFTFLT